MQRPPAAGQLPGLDGVVAHGGQPVAPRLPGQQHAAGLHVFLPHHRLAGGLRAVWGRQRGERQGSRRGEGCTFSSKGGRGSGLRPDAPAPSHVHAHRAHWPAPLLQANDLSSGCCATQLPGNSPLRRQPSQRRTVRTYRHPSSFSPPATVPRWDLRCSQSAGTEPTFVGHHCRPSRSLAPFSVPPATPGAPCGAFSASVLGHVGWWVLCYGDCPVHCRPRKRSLAMTH